MRRALRSAAFVAFVCVAAPAAAQQISQQALIEARGYLFPQLAPADREHPVADALVREEVTLSLGSPVRIVAGLDLRANSHDQVEDEWRLDWEDRGLRRPRASLRRLSVGLSTGRLTLDVGKQFVRWGRADVIYPTDRFAPRDYMNVVDSELLPIIAARAEVQFGSESLEGIWTPQMTPTRMPRLDQRWTVIPEETTVAVADRGSDVPDGSQYGVRWRHTGPRIETAIEVFQGFNHLPNIDVGPVPAGVELIRTYPRIRMYGADVALPTPWLTLKLEAAYVEARRGDTEEYVLYAVEVERQIGEWLIDVGYADDVVTNEHPVPSFAPDRGMAESFIGRASYTIDPNRTMTFESAVRQKGDGVYWKMEYSQAIGPYVRLSLWAVALGGDRDNFLGQYRRNSHAAASLRVRF